MAASDRGTKRREATKTAMEKIQSNAFFNDSDNSHDEDSDVDEKSKLSAAKAKSASKSGRSSSLLSSSNSSLSIDVGQKGAKGRNLTHTRKPKDNAVSGGSLKKKSSRLGDPEWEVALWGEERVASVTKAIDR